MPDYDLNKKVPISADDLSRAIVRAMKTEPFASIINETYGIEKVFFVFGARVGSILFEERIRVEK